jgi:hypothetical protein
METMLKSFILGVFLLLHVKTNAQNNKPFPFHEKNHDQGKQNATDPSFLECAWFAPNENVGTVGKFHKLELGFRLCTSAQKKIKSFVQKGDTLGINPFDPDQISFEADFVSPSGKSCRRFGFYYLPFLENNNFDHWDSDTTSFPWRLRFAPDEIGEWQINITVYIKNNKSPILKELSFKCLASSHKGLLVKPGDETDRYLSYSETKEPFFALSNNISSGGFLTYKPSQNRRQMKGVQQLIDVGGNFTRFDMQPQAALPDWPVHDNYSLKLDEMYAFDRMVELCESNGIYFIVFRHHVELMDSYYNPGGSDWSGVSWFDNPYRIGLSLNKKNDYLTNAEAIEWQKKSLRYVFSRWGYSPSFSFYGYSEINNWYSGIVKEEQKMDSKYSEKEALLAFKDWYVDQKQYIQEDLDSKVLFSNSYSTVPDWEKSKRFDGLFRHSDVISLHDYETIKDVNYKRRSQKVADYWNIYKKPIIIEEMGVSDNKLRIYCCTGIEYHNSIWSTAMMGTVGTGMDWWWDRGVHDFGYHKDLEHIHAFFEGEDLLAQHFTPQKWADSKITAKRLLENYALVSENQKRALGWVHNATFYWRNLESEYPCIKELVDKSSLSNGCFVGDGYDINTEGPGDYASGRFKDRYTDQGGAQSIMVTDLQNGPTFKIYGLKPSFGKDKNWYLVEFYRTNGVALAVDDDSRQVLSTNARGILMPKIPTLDKLNPDYSYKIIFLDQSNKKPLANFSSTLQKK